MNREFLLPRPSNHQRRILRAAMVQEIVWVGVVPVGLIVLSLVASYLPARRAARVDPLISMRSE